jgi:hypothetical protein
MLKLPQNDSFKEALADFRPAKRLDPWVIDQVIKLAGIPYFKTCIKLCIK